jgi:hypothetical protein
MVNIQTINKQLIHLLFMPFMLHELSNLKIKRKEYTVLTFFEDFDRMTKKGHQFFRNGNW